MRRVSPMRQVNSMSPVNSGQAKETAMNRSKSRSTSRFTKIAVIFSLVAAIAIGWAAPAGAAPLYWDNAASAGLWIDDGATFNWSATLGGVAGVYTDSAWVGGSETIAHFEGTAGVVTLDSAGIASVGSISFDTDGYTLGNVVDNGTITLTGTGGNITTGAGLNTINSIIGGGVGLTKLGTATPAGPRSAMARCSSPSSSRCPPPASWP